MRCQIALAACHQPDRVLHTLELEADASEPLSRALWLSGKLRPRALCGGLGQCGRCRLRFLGKAPAWQSAEEAVFSQAELAMGWRLSCRHSLGELGDSPCVLLLPATSFLQSKEAEPVTKRPACEKFLLALDLGTTSVCWQLLQAKTGQCQAQGQFLNPQAAVGSDVVSRLAYARSPSQRQRLATLVREALVQAIACHADISQLALLVLAANTAMAEIFLDCDVEGLCAAPYRLGHKGHEWLTLPNFPPIYLPPLPGPFVGSDVTCGLVPVLAEALPKPWLLVDLGTNAEFALMGDELFLASVPMGPAIEGIGMRCGQLAASDVITSFDLGPWGLVAQCPNASACPRGISATGYLRLLSLLLRTGLLSADGHFQTTQTMPILRKISEQFLQSAGSLRLNLPHGLFLEARDVEEMLKVKAAFATALRFLLAAAGYQLQDLSRIVLAGALGSHGDPSDLETLGFFPLGTASKIVSYGNTALAGAARLALSESLRETLWTLCRKAKVLSLTEEAGFQSSFVAAMRFGT